MKHKKNKKIYRKPEIRIDKLKLHSVMDILGNNGFSKNTNYPGGYSGSLAAVKS